jgi:hypothetical protein
VDDEWRSRWRVREPVEARLSRIPASQSVCCQKLLGNLRKSEGETLTTLRQLGRIAIYLYCPLWAKDSQQAGIT